MRKVLDAGIASLVPCLMLFYISAAPHAGGDESFALEAIHDLLTHGIRGNGTAAHLRAHYAHLSSPPQSFLAPLLLAGACAPLQWLVAGVQRQLLVRAALGLANAFAVLAYRNAVARAFGRGAANWYALLQAGQFTVLFWASRTEPHYLALAPYLLAQRAFLPRASDARGTDEARAAARREAQAVALLAGLAVALRYEVAALLAAHAAHMYVARRQTARSLLASTTAGAACGLLAAVPLDTFMWQSPVPVWAELSAMLSSEPAPAFPSALPGILLQPLALFALVPVALAHPVLRPSSVPLFLASTPLAALAQLRGASPHVFAYASAPLTALAARAAAHVWDRRARSPAAALVAPLAVLISFVASAVLAGLAPLTYPGAAALNALHALADGDQPALRVHMDAAACAAGAASPFLRVPELPQAVPGRTAWAYSGPLGGPDAWDRADYALVAEPARASGDWEIVRAAKGLHGLQVLAPGEAARHSCDYGELPAWPLGQGPWEGGSEAGEAWAAVEEAARTYVTRGWWVAPKMEPQIYVLRKTSGPGASLE